VADSRPASLLAASPEEAERIAVELGGRPFHARVARRELLAKGVLDYREMTSLPKALCEELERELPLLAGRELSRATASDGTVKLLVGYGAEAKLAVETVFIPSRRPGRGATLCVSTQIGCPVGCPFCASGKAGLVRNLAAHEILEQYARGRAEGELSRSVVMGIGEPLLNYENLSSALDAVRTEVRLGARRITVSTVGFPARLRRIAPEKPGFQLAISLHTPDDAQRDLLVPAMAGVPIEELLSAGDFWFEQTGREVTYEYALLGGVNDTPEHAERLAARLARRRALVNLIPYNPIGDDPSGGGPSGTGSSRGGALGIGFERPSAAAVERFRGALEAAGIVATVRWSRGLEAAAACGQLRLRETLPGVGS
jgi:23S rRNA (adenine2503-C2)-methyltransferase